MGEEIVKICVCDICGEEERLKQTGTYMNDFKITYCFEAPTFKPVIIGDKTLTLCKSCFEKLMIHINCMKGANE